MQDQQLPADLPSLSPDPPEAPATGQTSSVPKQSDSPAAQAVSDPKTSQHSVKTPDDAADNDLIEKEWVTKAKQIVEHTRDNPYEQQKAIEKFKAEYMKKRYNKTIRITDN